LIKNKIGEDIDYHRELKINRTKIVIISEFLTLPYFSIINELLKFANCIIHSGINDEKILDEQPSPPSPL